MGVQRQHALKADGSRERCEPWSEGGGYWQLCCLYISTKPERKKAGLGDSVPQYYT